MEVGPIFSRKYESTLGNSYQIESYLYKQLNTRPRKVKKFFFASKTLGNLSYQIDNCINIHILKSKVKKEVTTIEIDLYSKKHKGNRLAVKMNVDKKGNNEYNCLVEDYIDGYDRVYSTYEYFITRKGKHTIEIHEFGNNKLEIFRKDNKICSLIYYHNGFIHAMFTINKNKCYQHFTMAQNKRGSISAPTILIGLSILAILGIVWYYFNLLVSVSVFFISFGIVNWVSVKHHNLHPVWRGILCALYGTLFALLRFII